MSPQKYFSVALLAVFALACTLRLLFHVQSASALSDGLRVVSSARFTSPVSAGSIATIFPLAGPLTSLQNQASALPLPTTLAGAQVLIDGEAAQLFYVSAGQINFLVPGGLTSGPHAIEVVGAGGERTAGEMHVGNNPAIFTAPGMAIGWAAAVTTQDGRNFSPTIDAALRAIPVDVGTYAAPNYLILYGTGLRVLPLSAVRIGVVSCPVSYAGAHPDLPGLDQINVQLRPELLGAGECFVTVEAGPYLANLSKVVIR